jgi:hypothetical protein
VRLARAALVLVTLAVAGRAEPARARVSERLLAVHQPDVTLAFTASPDVRRLAWLELADARYRVVLDGRAIASWPRAAALTFSPDGQHLAYIARLDPTPDASVEYTVVVDGREHGRYISVQAPVLDLEARNVGFTAQERYGPTVAVVNGVAQSDNDTAVTGTVRVSRSGGRFAYVERNDARMRVVADGVPHPWYDFVSPASLTFSPDGRHLGYVAGNSFPLFILDGSAVGESEAALSLAFDSAGSAVAWTINDGLRWRLRARYPGRVIDRELEEVPLSLLFSPGGEHLAMTLRRPLGTTLVTLDDSVVAEPDGAKGLCFSADGKTLAWAEAVKGGWRIVAGGRASQRFADVWFLTLSPDGKHYACVVRAKRRFDVVFDGEAVGRYDDLVSGFAFEPGGELRFMARRRDRYLLVSVSPAQ